MVVVCRGINLVATTIHLVLASLDRFNTYVFRSN